MSVHLSFELRSTGFSPQDQPSADVLYLDLYTGRGSVSGSRITWNRQHISMPNQFPTSLCRLLIHKNHSWLRCRFPSGTHFHNAQYKLNWICFFNLILIKFSSHCYICETVRETNRESKNKLVTVKTKNLVVNLFLKIYLCRKWINRIYLT